MINKDALYDRDIDLYYILDNKEMYGGTFSGCDYRIEEISADKKVLHIIKCGINIYQLDVSYIEAIDDIAADIDYLITTIKVKEYKCKLTEEINRLCDEAIYRLKNNIKVDDLDNEIMKTEMLCKD